MMNGLLRVSFILVLLLAALSAVHAQCAANDYLCCGPNGGCTDSDQDSNNCGECGNECADGEVCCDGMCSVETCNICNFSPASCGSTNACACCDGNAIDTDTDESHCGSCDDPCSGGDLCCGGECRDALNDNEACGCIANNCTEIGEGWGCCGGQCVNLDTDPLNCGSCFNNVTGLPGGCCVDGSVFTSPCDNCYEAADDQDMCCWNGTNTPQPCTGLTPLCCDGICIDPNGFSTCGCPSVACSGGESCCGEVCVLNTDFDDDRDNCGACNNQCDPNEFCDTGSCTVYDNTNCGMAMADCDSSSQFCCEDSCVDGDVDSQCGSLCDNCDDDGRICCPNGGDFQCVNPMVNGNCGGCGVTCGAGQVCCQGECANLQTSSDHCGVCGNDCGADACCSGECATTNENCGACGATCTGDDCCSEVAVKDHECVVACKLYDNDNCGSCGNACEVDELCCQGECKSSSDFTDDEQNCGACELACDAASECCLDSECVDNEGFSTEDFCGSCEPCDPGQCCFPDGGDSYQCVPTTIGTEEHCSGCHDACSTNECCVSGVCTVVDFENNPDHCGSCGADCGADCCRDSECVDPGDLSNDPQNCGSCGVVCDDECCDGVCADTETDEDNCGSCGNPCSTGQVCQDGFCIDQPSCLELQHVMGDQYRVVDVPCVGPCDCDTFACADGQSTCTLSDLVWYPTGGFATDPMCTLPDQVRWVFEEIDPLPTLPEFGTAEAAYMVSLLCGTDPNYDIIELSTNTLFSFQLSRKRATIVVQTIYWYNGLNWVDGCTGCDPSCQPGQTCHTGMLAVGYRSIESTTGQPGNDPVGPSPAPSPATTGSQSPISSGGAPPSPATGTTTAGSTGSSTAAATTTTGLPPASSPASVVHVSASVLLFLFAALLALF